MVLKRTAKRVNDGTNNVPQVFDPFHANYLSVLNSAPDLQDSETEFLSDSW